ncbi:MAG: hypothetical protein FJW30_01605 [Acidobacteria bacterium]|nr:hypothetical protein [Acidobacteriota bacterium]
MTHRALLLLLAAGLALAQRKAEYGAPVSDEAARVYASAKTGGNYMQAYYIPATASTPWRPCFSPDGEWIAFSMAGSIWKIPREGGTAEQLTANKTYDSSPVWSPDGRYIAYTADHAYLHVRLMLLDLQTGESRALTQGESVNLDPAWSPDGKSIVYVSTAAKGWFHLHRADIASGRIQQLTTDHLFPRSRLYFGAMDLHIQPSVSPDGRELLLVSNRNIPLGSGGIWRAPLTQDPMADAALLLKEETLYRTRPQWSPDGARILYSSHRGSQYTNLYLIPAKGGEPYQLTYDEWDHFDPRWSPDGDQMVYVSNRQGVSELRLRGSFTGEDVPIAIRDRKPKGPTGTLSVALAGPARIQLTGSDGKAYAPATAFQRVAARAQHFDFFHVNGAFKVDLPAGETTLIVMNGLERIPVTRKVTIQPGQTAAVNVALERFTDWKARGWYSGSDHIHMNYGGNLHNTPENMLFMAAAEDLDVVGEKIANKDNRVFDHQFFDGPFDTKRSTPGRILSFGQEWRPPFWGHLNLINLSKHLIAPFTTGYEETAIDSLYPSSTDIYRAAVKQGALGGFVHAFPAEPEKNGYGLARGFAHDMALESFQYIEIMTSATYAMHGARVWHRALNCGYRITAAGGEDSITGLHRTPILGSGRMYAYMGPKLTWQGWVEAIRKGRTFVTNGPLLSLTVNGQRPGSQIDVTPGASVRVAAIVESAFPVDKVELFLNGEPVQSVDAAPARRHAWNWTIPIPRSGWLTLRATSSKAAPLADDTHLYAETSPVYVIAGGKPIRSKKDAEYFLRWIDDVAHQAETDPNWRSEKEKAHVRAQFDEAARRLRERAVD